MRLRVIRRLHERIRTNESPKDRILHPPIHMNEPHLIEMLVPRIPPLDLMRSRERAPERRPVGGISSQAPGIERQRLIDGAGRVRHLHHAPLMVAVQVLPRVGRRDALDHGYTQVPRLHVVPVGIGRRVLELEQGAGIADGDVTAALILPTCAEVIFPSLRG